MGLSEGRARGQEKGGRRVHPPGICLAVVLSCHNVLEELTTSDPAGNTHWTQIPEARVTTTPISASSTSALLHCPPGQMAAEYLLTHSGI